MAGTHAATPASDDVGPASDGVTPPPPHLLKPPPPQNSPAGQAPDPHWMEPPQPSAPTPQSYPRSAHVFGTHEDTDPSPAIEALPHWLYPPPAPHCCVPVQTPQSRVPVQPSPLAPQV